jgi:hypothetical protein
MNNTSLEILKANLESLSSSKRWSYCSYDICMNMGTEETYKVQLNPNFLETYIKNTASGAV